MVLANMPLVHHKIHLVVLHGRVKELLECDGQAMDFINKQDVAFAEVGEDAHQVARPLQRRPRGGCDFRSHDIGDNVSKSGLAQARRAVEQHMLKCFAPLLSRPVSAMESFSTTFFCPTYSSRVGGRRVRLKLSSSFEISSGETKRSLGIENQRAIVVTLFSGESCGLRRRFHLP